MGGSSPFTSPYPSVPLSASTGAAWGSIATPPFITRTTAKSPCTYSERESSVLSHLCQPLIVSAFLSEPGFASDFPITDEEVESVVDGLYHDVGSQPPTASGSEAPVSSHGVRSTRKAVYVTVSFCTHTSVSNIASSSAVVPRGVSSALVPSNGVRTPQVSRTSPRGRRPRWSLLATKYDNVSPRRRPHE